jgi:hypothetical protein
VTVCSSEVNSADGASFGEDVGGVTSQINNNTAPPSSTSADVKRCMMEPPNRI